jgi:hypothetical protein
MLPFRPSKKEICNKVADALAALKAGRFQIGPTKHLSGDLEALQLATTKDLSNLLIVLLEEVKNADPIKCYAGTRPPHRSYEPEILHLELWAYRWHSASLCKWMYLKFTLKKEWYVYVDCHEDRPERQL